jgi:type I restriction enzyme M protein
MTEPALPPVLDLARLRSLERSRFAEFLTRLKTSLRAWKIAFAGRSGSLAAYLDWRQSQGAATLNDEQPVVDTLSRRLLEALGYREGSDFVYNERLPELPDRVVPDFTVRVEEFLGPLPVFVIEDKSTSVLDLQRRRPLGEGAESPLEQLRRYVLSGAVHGRVGLLCNGWKLESWEFGGEDDTRLVRVDLHLLARAACDEGGDFPGEQAGGLQTLWNRFSRAAFVQAVDLRGSALEPLLVPAASVQRIGSVFAKTGRPHDLEQGLLTYYEQVWREQALDVSVASELLVDVLRGLIEQFAADVLHQLDDSLLRHQEYEGERRRLEQSSQLPTLRQPIALSQPRLNLSRDDFESLLLKPLDAWCQHPRLDDVDARVREWTAALAIHLKQSHDPAVHQLPLGKNEVAPEAHAPAKRVPQSGGMKFLANLAGDLGKLCRQALNEFAARQQLDDDYRAGIRVAGAYRAWAQRVSSSVLIGQPESMFRIEFARQTAYVYIVRLLLVRICEDKGLFRRKLSDGGLLLWQERVSQYLDYASGRSYEYLTRMAYECAQNVYVHFYGASELFDWYRMDDKMLFRALLVLNAFNLAGINTDIIGAVYGRYLEEGKHEQGRYYTPKPLVSAMLDLLGYEGEPIVERRIADLACGSGSFLVEACRRLLSRFQGSDGRIPRAKLRPALEQVQRSLYGIELNPFACYLAETNLLIQVLDLIREAKDCGITLAVDRFRIYCEDSLLVDQALIEASEGSILLLGKDKATAELLKGRAGPFRDGFDFLVGNPPYVRADEDAPAYLAYRHSLERQAWFTTRHLKWDLYVPFVEQYHRLLADHSGARCCLVTIESISTTPYAHKLREFLARQTTLHDILFTKGLKLFEDARWQDNVVFSFSRGVAGGEHRVRRQMARARAADGSLQIEALDTISQASADPERLFSTQIEVDLDLGSTRPFEEICYVTKGMVLHSTERLKTGDIITVPAAYDPRQFGEALVEDLQERGKRVRHQAFERDDLVAETADELHSRPYLDPRELLLGGIGRVRWLEYGAGARCPSLVSRPTFPELYQGPKIMFGTFTGIAVDDGSCGWLVAPHSMTIAVRWSNLVQVDNRALQKARKALAEDGRYDPSASAEFSEWYLCALASSAPIQQWLQSHQRSMKQHVYPDDIKAIPVKVLAADAQQAFVMLEHERHELWRELRTLQDDGFEIGRNIEIPVHRLMSTFRAEHPEVPHLLVGSLPASLIEFDDSAYDRDLSKARAVGSQVMVKRELVARIGAAVVAKEAIARLAARFLQSLPGTLGDRLGLDALPRTEAGLLALAEYLLGQEEGVRRRQIRIEAIQAEIDGLAWRLYRPGA